MTMTADLEQDRSLRARAARALPAGMYGHMRTDQIGTQYPQFMQRGEGSYLWDTDGKRYLDLMCGWGPVVLGRRHPVVDAAASEAMQRGECLNGPSPAIVELAELMVDTIDHADWAMFAKNGTDATTTCVTLARAATGRRKVLAANGAYHGAAPWCTPRPGGVLDEDRAHLDYFDFNNEMSLDEAVKRAGDDLAAIIVSPIRQELAREQEWATESFARATREACDKAGALLILDDVRCGFRLDLRGSWAGYGVQPDLAAWSKAIANGYALAAITGTDALRDATQQIYVTGSFWYAGMSMSAAIATINQLRDTPALATIERAGSRLREGLLRQASDHGISVQHSGPVQMPLLTIDGDTDNALVRLWAQECIERGVYLHPVHNWFMNASLTDQDIDWALERTNEAFDVVSRHAATR